MVVENDVQELANPKALRIFVKPEDLDFGVTMLLKRRRDLNLTPSAITFLCDEGEWEIILWGQ